MSKNTAGLILYRQPPSYHCGDTTLLLCHPSVFNPYSVSTAMKRKCRNIACRIKAVYDLKVTINVSPPSLPRVSPATDPWWG